MMKTKFLAGLVATLISLVFVVIAAILIASFLENRTGDRFIKVVAFATIGIWIALYAWLKPKDLSANPNQNNSNASGEVKQVIKPRETTQHDRNSRRYN